MAKIAELIVQIRDWITRRCLAFPEAKGIFEAKEALSEVADHRPSPIHFA